MAPIDIFRLLGYGMTTFAQTYEFNRLVRTVQSFHRVQFLSDKKSLTKRPPLPFCRFVIEFQSDVLEKYPGIDRKDLLRRLSVMWYELSEEQRISYSTEYRIAKQKYMEKLGPEEKDELLAKRRKRIRKKERGTFASKMTSQIVAYDKPRKPPTAYLLFLQSKLKERYSQVQQISETIPRARELVKSLADEWKRLDDDKKVAFKERAAEMNREYKSRLKTWEDDVVRIGRSDLLPRSKQLNVSTISEYLQVKNESPKNE